MPNYCFSCECGENAEVFRSIDHRLNAPVCNCGKIMSRSFQAENVMSGNKEYGETKWSDALAISPTQIEEHKRLFPDVRVDNQGRIGFDNYQQHDNYLKKTGFVKHPQKIRKKKGVRIA